MSSTSTKPVSIDAHQPQVLLRPEDDDLFVRTGKQVIEACRLTVSIDLWLDELKAMFNEVNQWCAQRANKVRACFASSGSKVTLFFVPARDQFDFDLARELAQLNTDIVKKFNIGMVETRQIPWVERDRFIDPATARLIYGDPGSAHHPVEA